MAVLGALSRRQVWAHLMRTVSGLGGFTKAELQSAVDAADSWVDTNAAEYNTALPQPFRANATPAQKAVLIAYVCFRRAGLLTVEGD